ncbi:albusnodin family lasso peptide [Streptomyces nodosus]|uniref:Albusnodin family lasso peptide n=1 Tax=Streptomyces nodosus TaxID=40318 RepID=A0A5P2VVT9_9ACTN|nr:albusnodin family lasso peptide [Streptomyces nodosus]MBB4789444.1 hypothetical protein [Streptomyces nodosus]QEV37305.1 albusnodin family lasso peptide [Streptomyces nodosus]
MDENTIPGHEHGTPAVLESDIVELGDAAVLTKGNTSSSVEAKQTPYS